MLDGMVSEDSLAERPLQIGDFVPHLTKTNTFCCVWTAPRGGIAEVVDFLVVGLVSLAHTVGQCRLRFSVLEQQERRDLFLLGKLQRAPRALRGGETFLSCSICSSSDAGRGGSKFGESRYKVTKYFYDRTLQEHEQKCKKLVELVKQRSDKGSPSKPIVESPVKTSSDKGSPSKQMIADSPVKTSPSKSSTSSPSSSSKTAGRSKLLQQLKNMLVGVHMTVSNMHGARVYSMMLYFARMTGGTVPVGTDSGTVFTECLTILADETTRAMVTEVKRSEFYSLSIDEKDRMDAADLTNFITAALDEHELKGTGLVAFTADGASVMGTRQSLSGLGNVAKHLETFAGGHLLTTHCCPHRLQLCCSDTLSEADAWLKDLEKRIKALQRHLQFSAAATIDLLFWCDLTGEEMVNSMGTSLSRTPKQDKAWPPDLSPVDSSSLTSGAWRLTQSGWGTVNALISHSPSEGLIQASLPVKDFLGDATSAILEVITPTERELVTLANSLQGAFRTKTDFESVFFAHADEDGATSQRVLCQSGFEQILSVAVPKDLVDPESLFLAITGANVDSISLERWCLLGLEHVEVVQQCRLFADSAGQETLQLLMPGTCCQCLAPPELTGVRKVLVGDSTGFLEVAYTRKAWPQIQLSAATVDADLAQLHAKAADAGEEAEEARAAEEDEAIDRVLGLEAGDDEEDLQPQSQVQPQICVARVVNDITKNIVREEAERAGKDPADLPPYKFSSQALEVVQTALEGYLTDRFADMNALAHHGKRVTVRPEDARLYKRLRRKSLIKSWLHMYAQRVITPLLPDLATRVVGAYGAVINIDFSSSDSKQLLPKRRQRVPTAKTSQVGCGLGAALSWPLPAMEENEPGELLPAWMICHRSFFLVHLRLAARAGARPVAICFDDLENSWLIAANALEAHFPAQVHRKFVAPQCPLTERHEEMLADGHIILDRDHRKPSSGAAGMLRGVFAAQDNSCIAGLMFQAQTAVEHVKAEMAEGFAKLQWLAVGDFAATDMNQLLQAYFRGEVIPQDAFGFLSRHTHTGWKHPDSDQALPDRARAVILQDLARVTDLAGFLMQEVRRQVDMLLYKAEISVESITAELSAFENLFRHRCFATMAGRGNGLWARAQLRYLRHVKTRPRGPKKSTRATSRCNAGCGLVAGGACLAKAIRQQKRPVVVQGLIAAHQAKAWAAARGWSLSAGTIGTERLWRNRQRRAKNKARAVGDAITVNLLELSRWQAEVQSRMLHQHGRADVAVQPWLSSASDRVAAALLLDDASDSLHAPLAAEPVGPQADPFQEDFIGGLYEAFARGEL
ncbi:hht3 [Symbiodinium sp. KB8]|nr:hht3 [Symbiodinium sp. KB8]